MTTDRSALAPLRLAAAVLVASSLVVASAPVSAAAPDAPVSSEGAAPGDLGARADAATAARKADPSATHWRAEAETHEALGNWAAAAAAYRGELEALPSDDLQARRRSEADWERVREEARGRVEGEPASTHRAEFDRQWAPPVPPDQLRPAPRPKADPTLDDDARDDRIITKWYFWVTVAAIAASAGAVAGIAIKAARDERDDALDASAFGPMGPSPRGPALIRF